MPKLFLPVLLLFASIVNGQADTGRYYVPETWKNFELGIRVAAGIQKNFYTEVGLSLQKYVYMARHGYMAYAFYSTFEWVPATKGKEQVNAVKAGAEMVNNGATGAIELKYQYNSQSHDFVITPKYGFGLGFVTLFYGYNISTEKYPFPNVRKHQFSLAINTNIFFHYLFKEKKDKGNK